MKKETNIKTIFFILFILSSAIAESDDGLDHHIGIGLSYTEAKTHTIPEEGMVDLTMQYGYSLFDNLDIETRSSFQLFGGKSLNHIYSFGLYLKPNFNLTENLNIYGMLGYGQYGLKLIKSGPKKGEATIQNSESYGFGAEYEIIDGMNIYLDYMSYIDKTLKIDKSTYAININSIGFGVNFKFGLLDSYKCPQCKNTQPNYNQYKNNSYVRDRQYGYNPANYRGQPYTNNSNMRYYNQQYQYDARMHRGQQQYYVYNPNIQYNPANYRGRSYLNNSQEAYYVNKQQYGYAPNYVSQNRNNTPQYNRSVPANYYQFKQPLIQDNGKKLRIFYSKDRYKIVIDKYIKFLRSHPSINVTISGVICLSKDCRINISPTRMRAILIKKGISRSRIRVR